MHMWQSPKFLKATRLVVVLSVLLICRNWLYVQYFLLHGYSELSQVAVCVVLALTTYLLFTVKHAVQTQSFMTGGLYRFVAHPTYTMYLFTDVWLWYLMPLTVYSVTTGILFYAVIIITAYMEEASLISGFGKKAKSYYMHTPSLHFILFRIKPQ